MLEMEKTHNDMSYNIHIMHNYCIFCLLGRCKSICSCKCPKIIVLRLSRGCFESSEIIRRYLNSKFWCIFFKQKILNSLLIVNLWLTNFWIKFFLLQNFFRIIYILKKGMIVSIALLHSSNSPGSVRRSFMANKYLTISVNPLWWI